MVTGSKWGPIRSVIIIVINEIGRPRSGICLIRSMTELDDQLPVKNNFNKICDILGSFLNQSTRNSVFFPSCEKKKPFKRSSDSAYCPITYA